MCARQLATDRTSGWSEVCRKQRLACKHLPARAAREHLWFSLHYEPLFKASRQGALSVLRRCCRGLHPVPSEMALPLMKPVSASWPEAFDHEGANHGFHGACGALLVRKACKPVSFRHVSFPFPSLQSFVPLVPRLAARVSCCRR